MFPAFARFSENVTTFAPRYGNNETLSDSGRSTSRFLAKGQTVPVVGLFISGDSFGIAFFFAESIRTMIFRMTINPIFVPYEE